MPFESQERLSCHTMDMNSDRFPLETSSGNKKKMKDVNSFPIL